jgi:hypothetical protein
MPEKGLASFQIYLLSNFSTGYSRKKHKMDPAERQALHNVKEELQNCAVITDKMLVHLLQNQKITKAEKYELSVSIILVAFFT